MLDVRALGSRYGRIPALHDVSLRVGAGELVALVGANGAGKSTLLRTLSGVQPASAGAIGFEGRNLGARGDMLMSSMMGAIAFQKDLGAVHSCAHALSTVADLHHGLANGIMIDHVMRFNAPAASAKLAELARVARVPGGDSGSDEARADAFVAWLVRLKSDLGIPAKLSHYAAARRVTADDIARLVEIAVADTCHQTNPRPCTADDFRRIFAAAM